MTNTKAINILRGQESAYWDTLSEAEHKAFNKAIEALEAAVWVSVKDRPPKEKGWYEVYAPSYTGGSSSGLDNHSGVMFAKWSGKTWSIEVGYHKRPGCVTHWKPITEPPKEDNDENHV